MRLAYLALAAVLAPSIAAACPQPPPGEEFHCAKYDHMRDMNVVKVQPPPAIYARAGRAKFPRTKKRLLRLLTTSVWRADGGDTLQLLDGSDIPDTIDLRADARTVIVRTITRTDDTWTIEMDGYDYTLHPCKIGRRATVCLTTG